MFRVFLCITLLSVVSNVKLPPKFPTCKRQQPDLGECVLNAAQYGVAHLTELVEQLHLPSIDPFFVESATIGAGKGTVAVTQNFKNCNIYGLLNLKFDHFEFDFEKKNLIARGVIPEIKLLSQYDLDGKVLLLPIRGNGPSTIILKNLKYDATLKYEEIKKNKKTFFRFTSSQLDLDPELISFNFENLFDGDKRLGDNINQVLNENWKEVFSDVKEGYIELVNQVLLNAFDQFFHKVSYEELFE